MKSKANLNLLKRISMGFMCIYAIAYLIPFVVYAIDIPVPEKPSQVTVVKTGNWGLNDALNFDDTYISVDTDVYSDGVIPEYVGDANQDASKELKPIIFSVKNPVMIDSVYVEIVNLNKNYAKEIKLAFKSESGQIFGGQFNAKVSQNEIATNQQLPSITATARPMGIVLPQGQYTLYNSLEKATIYNSETGYVGAVLIKGVDYSNYQNYLKKMNIYDAQIKKEKGDKKDDKSLLTEEVEKVSGLPNDIEIKLKEPAVILEIQTEHVYSLKLIPTGTLGIKGDDGKTYSFQARAIATKGGDNIVWQVLPNIALPAGTYKIIDSKSELLAKDGTNPKYIIKAMPIPQENMTGTYGVNIVTNVKNKDLQNIDTQIAVVDRGKTLEVVGKYKDIPFSQSCDVKSRENGMVVADFSLNVNIPNIKYKEAVGAAVTIAILKSKDGREPVKIGITGSASYVRPYTEKYGGDDHQYTVKGTGVRLSTKLPDYVEYAIKNQMSVGNIPGPANNTQAAVGLLFPILAALIAQVGASMPKKAPKVRIIPDADEGGNNEGNSEGSSFSSGGDSESIGDSGGDTGGDQSGDSSEGNGSSEDGNYDSEGDSGDEGSDDGGDGSSESENTSSSEDKGYENNTQNSGDQNSDENINDESQGEDRNIEPSNNSTGDNVAGVETNKDNTQVQNDGEEKVNNSDLDKNQLDSLGAMDNLKDLKNILDDLSDNGKEGEAASGTSLNDLANGILNSTDDIVKKLLGDTTPAEGDDKGWADYFAGLYGAIPENKFFDNVQKCFDALHEGAKDAAYAIVNGVPEVVNKDQLQLAKDAYSSSKAMQGARNTLSNGMDIFGIVTGALDNMTPTVQDNGTNYVEGDGVGKALVKSFVASKVSAAIVEKVPQLAVVELANYLAFGGSKAADAFSPSKAITGSVNMAGDLINDVISGTDVTSARIKNGAYGTVVSNYADLTKETIKDPTGVLGDGVDIFVKNRQVYDSMRTDVDELFKPANNAGSAKKLICGAGAGATKIMIWTTQGAAAGLNAAGEAIGKGAGEAVNIAEAGLDKVSSGIKSIFGW